MVSDKLLRHIKLAKHARIKCVSIGNGLPLEIVPYLHASATKIHLKSFKCSLTIDYLNITHL